MRRACKSRSAQAEKPEGLTYIYSDNIIFAIHFCPVYTVRIVMLWDRLGTCFRIGRLDACSFAVIGSQLVGDKSITQVIAQVADVFVNLA